MHHETVTRDVYMQAFAVDGERLVAQLGASAEQITTFAHEISAAMLARFAELKAATVRTGGQA